MNPDTYTNQELFLDVGDGHKLYVHDWGNKGAATPIIFLHGGPGAHTHDGHKENFDPTVHRVIFFDQRGAGKSLPLGELTNNTTQHLIEDISRVAEHFNIASFTLFGRSWGSFLALAYAIEHPDRVASIFTGGVIVGTSAELDLEDGRGERYHQFFPEAYEAFMSQMPPEAHDMPLVFCTKKILSDDPVEAKKYAFAFSQLMLACIRLDDRPRVQDFETFTIDEAKTEAHYRINKYFVDETYIMDNAAKLTMPIWIVQGRYDVLTAPKIAYQLHKKLPRSKLLWATAGHSGSDRATIDINRAILLELGGL